jgi:hypothetical protein
MYTLLHGICLFYLWDKFDTFMKIDVFFFISVAANQTVRVVLDSPYLHLVEKYATDTVTFCFTNRRILHTHFTINPWVKIVFHQIVDVSLVVVYNRQQGHYGKCLQQTVSNQCF